jgi:hypothetical protein
VKEPVIKTYYDNRAIKEENPEVKEVEKPIHKPSEENFSLTNVGEKKAFIVGLSTIAIIVLIIIIWMIF